MKKLSISISDALKICSFDRACEMCKRSGFDAIDYNLEFLYPLEHGVYAASDEEFEEHFYNVRKTAEKYDLEIGQTHGRSETYDPIDQSRREWSHKVTEKDLKATALLGAPSCVVHFINSTRWGKQPPEVMRNASNEMYQNVIPYAEKYKVNIALETFGAARIYGDRIRDFFADHNEYLMQYNKLDTQYKTMCVDTGHTHEAESFWVIPPEEYIRILGKDVTLLHLHDNSGHWDDHLLPGTGTIKWEAVFDALDDIGYQGNYNCELSLRYYGNCLEDYLHFVGKYMRKFVDNHGRP
jgi:sugar phosphate isomerase/epimerase